MGNGLGLLEGKSMKPIRASDMKVLIPYNINNIDKYQDNIDKYQDWFYRGKEIISWTTWRDFISQEIA